MATKLYVGGLSYETTDEELRQFFEQAGGVQSVSIAVDRYSGRSRGFAFVEMATQEEAGKAMSELNGKTLGGRTVTVQEARPRQDRGGQGGSRQQGDRGRRW